MDIFREFLHTNELMDMEVKGCKFTWHSNPRNGFVTQERLDRVLVNMAWRMQFEHALGTALPPVSSDHSPLVLWHRPHLRGSNSFKYEAMWEEHDECVEGAWIEGQKDIEKSILAHFQEIYTSSNQTPSLDCFLEFQRKVPEEMNNSLLMQVSDKDIEDAVFSMGDMKAPGPDGLNGLFYHKHWEVVSKEVIAVVKAFFQSGSLDPEINETVVALVPKVQRPESLQ
ncbi:Endonuclease/exonuclease/phosphatase superfamily [Sesbania bispinosa]|nr:Endonuclease/exonuclease/phosphatase superfamily [Sesbania bispinosa]